MARLPTISPADFAPELAAATGHPDDDQRVALGSLTVWANRPELAVAFLAFQETMAARSVLSPRLRELVRLRVAFHNQCRSCMAVRSRQAIDDGMDDGAVCSLERPQEADDLTAAEKAAIRYADLLATDHLAIDDGVFAPLREHFDDGEIVELGIHIGVCVGFGRLAMSWDIVDDLPDAFRSGDRAAPWLDDAVIR